MKKYGFIKMCLFCKSEFETQPRFVDYCSQACKNPNNRLGNTPWNKGIKLTDEQKAKQNTDGLKKGRGWNKGGTNEAQSIRWNGEGNPNWGGRVSKIRKEKGNLSRPGNLNGMFGKNHSIEAVSKMREAKLKNYVDGVYKSKSAGESLFAERLKETFPDLIWQFKLSNYHRVYDFYIPSLNLIVEYDGNYWHREEKYLNKDIKDTNKAIKKGFKIFRYWESTIKEKNIEVIIEDIRTLNGIYSRDFKEIKYVI